MFDLDSFVSQTPRLCNLQLKPNSLNPERSFKLRLSALLAILPLVAAAPAKRAEPAPLLAPRGDAELIADKYIVKFRDGSALSTLEDAIKSLTQMPDTRALSMYLVGLSSKNADLRTASRCSSRLATGRQ